MRTKLMITVPGWVAKEILKDVSNKSERITELLIKDHYETLKKNSKDKPLHKAPIVLRLFLFLKYIQIKGWFKTKVG